MSTDAIVLLKNDHKEMRAVFTAFEKAGDNKTNPESEGFFARVQEFFEDLRE